MLNAITFTTNMFHIGFPLDPTVSFRIEKKNPNTAGRIYAIASVPHIPRHII